MRREIILPSLLAFWLLLCALPTTSMGADDRLADGNTLLMHSSDPHEGGWISLEGGDSIIIPHLSAQLETSWSYPFDRASVFAENQTINGTFWGPGNRTGTKARVVISPFSVSALLRAFDAIENATAGQETIERGGQIVSLNGTGDATFALNGTGSGMYIILLLDENSSRALSATPLLVTAGTLGLQMPANITAGDFAKLKVNLSFAENRTHNQISNQSVIFAAALLSSRDYDNASIILQGNGSEESLNSTLIMANRSMQIAGLPRLSTDFLARAVYILPSDSAIGMQERKEPGAEIVLITDPAWEKGGYILTCGVYSPGKGLLAIRQQAVQIV